jgi:glyceraldehyde-3-phosphate dehydrogenase (NAD(P))
MKILVWADSITVKGDELIYLMAIHNESDVVPETVDAIRAVMNLCDAKTSMAKTDKALQIGEGEFQATMLVGEKGKETAVLC